jgi:two-component system chemotaxis response regulator CheB
MIGVFVVDDSPFVRKALRRVFQATPDLRVVGEAANAAEALARIPEAGAQVVTLDVDLQGASGLTVLRELTAARPELRVIMLSAHTQEGAVATLDALSAGAADFVDKQQLNFMDLDAVDRELSDRVRSLAGKSPPRAALPRAVAKLPSLREIELIAIGASTGGPIAIQGILERLPAGFPVPVVIAQHMPPGFTQAFARRLNTLCRLRVVEATPGMRLEPGLVAIAPAGQQLTLGASLVVSLTPPLSGSRHAPSVDLLFHSAAVARGSQVLGVLLTGMGNDGAEGLAAIHEAGGVTIAESEESCAVYGMPRAAVLRGAARAVLPLGVIAEVVQGAGSRRSEVGSRK